MSYFVKYREVLAVKKLMSNQMVKCVRIGQSDWKNITFVTDDFSDAVIVALEIGGIVEKIADYPDFIDSE